jgi:hypothetical protein
LKVDNEAAQRGEGSTEDTHVHHDSRHCKLLWESMRTGLNLLVPNTTLDIGP